MRNKTDESKILREKITLKQWTETIRLASPKILFAYKEICAYLEALPLCKLAVSLVIIIHFTTDTLKIAKNVLSAVLAENSDLTCILLLLLTAPTISY